MAMVTLRPADYPDVRSLFDPDIPNHPMLFSALEGRTSAICISDGQEAPISAVLRTDYSVAFATIDCDVEFLGSALRSLRQGRRVQLVWRDEHVPANLLPDATIAGLAFCRPPQDGAGLSSLVDSLPRDCRVTPMTSELLEQCLWREQVDLAYGGNISRFLQNGFGLCAVREGSVICEAYALFWGAGSVEIGVFVHEDFRGRNLAAIICAHMIQHCEARGYSAYWTCERTNGASQSVARKLGFKLEAEYDWLRYDAC